MDEFRKNGGSIRNVISHGRILSRPLRQPAGTKHSVAYELGHCFQLDKTHCLLVASMDEQGGGDLCVGNDGFIFEKLSDIKAEDAIPLNWPDEDYKFKRREGHAWLAKYPATGWFVPLEARLEDGKPHPAAGTGVLFSHCTTFNADRTSMEDDLETFMEAVQLVWDGTSLTVTQRSLIDEALGLKVADNTLAHFCPQGADLLSPLMTDKGIAVFRWVFDGRIWRITERGEPVLTSEADGWYGWAGEFEPSLRRQGNRYILYARGMDPVGRVYQSADGMNFKLWFEKKNCDVPQVLNQGLDGSLYLATNPNWDCLRNPLLAYPLEDGSFGEAILIHDEDGFRDDKGPKVPFIDHPVGMNTYLEGRWRHFLWYRVCDLRERTFHGFVDDLVMEDGTPHPARAFHKGGGPVARRENGGLYMVEFEYDRVVEVPFNFG